MEVLMRGSILQVALSTCDRACSCTIGGFFDEPMSERQMTRHDLKVFRKTRKMSKVMTDPFWKFYAGELSGGLVESKVRPYLRGRK
jgi:hypothetical protein